MASLNVNLGDVGRAEPETQAVPAKRVAKNGELVLATDGQKTYGQQQVARYSDSSNRIKTANRGVTSRGVISSAVVDDVPTTLRALRLASHAATNGL